jgi:hypothetical protein
VAESEEVGLSNPCPQPMLTPNPAHLHPNHRPSGPQYTSRCPHRPKCCCRRSRFSSSSRRGSKGPASPSPSFSTTRSSAASPHHQSRARKQAHRLRVVRYHIPSTEQHCYPVAKGGAAEELVGKAEGCGWAGWRIGELLFSFFFPRDATSFSPFLSDSFVMVSVGVVSVWWWCGRDGASKQPWVVRLKSIAFLNTRGIQTWLSVCETIEGRLPNIASCFEFRCERSAVNDFAETMTRSTRGR